MKIKNDKVFPEVHFPTSHQRRIIKMADNPRSLADWFGTIRDHARDRKMKYFEFNDEVFLTETGERHASVTEVLEIGFPDG